jgi:hypothetical protein
MLYLTKLFFSRRLNLLLCFLLLTGLCMAQTQPDVLTNANIVSLFKAGLSKSVIITTIKNSASKFDVSTNGIISLKKDGLPDDLIEAIVNKSSANPMASNSSIQENKIGNGPVMDKMEDGIYYEDPASGKQTPLEANVFSQSKLGSAVLMGLTYGIVKTKYKAVLSGTQANFHLNNPNPVFYFVFPYNNGGGNIGNEGNTNGFASNTTSPNEFILIKFKVAKKGREVVTGTIGTYSGFSGGIDDENKVAFRFTKVSPGFYKIYFETQIPEGEYAFIYAGTAASGTGTTTSQKAFDFSVTR